MADPERRYSPSSHLPPLTEHPDDPPPDTHLPPDDLSETDPNFPLDENFPAEEPPPPASAAPHNAAEHQGPVAGGELHRPTSTRSANDGHTGQATHSLPDLYGGVNEPDAPPPIQDYETQDATQHQSPVAGSEPYGGVSAHSTGERHSGHVSYSLPDSYGNLNEVAAPPPVQSYGTQDAAQHHNPVASSELHRRTSARSASDRHSGQVSYNLPDSYGNLNELAAPPPIPDRETQSFYRTRSLEDSREAERARTRHPEDGHGPVPGVPSQPLEVSEEEPPAETRWSRFATQLYTHSYLILFAMLGTWARLGLTSLTMYPGAPVTFPVIWCNFGGCLLLGFLAEDQMLFRQGYGAPGRAHDATNAVNAGETDLRPQTSSTTRKTRQEIKRTIPLYIGLATGFCGSFTSFSALIRDAFLAMSNDIISPDIGYPPRSRPGGHSFMAFLAVIITSIGLSVTGLFLGSHLAMELERITPTLPYKFTRKFLDPLMVPVGIGSWVTILFMSLFPPHAAWRGTPLLDLVFSPLGCLARFYLSTLLNGKISGFPLGTFAANVLGTTLLGMFWDLTHLPDAGLAGCQVLTSLQDGFCGTISTVSTWVLELATLRRTHAYIYGAASVLTSLIMLIVIMGSLRWSQGFVLALC